MNCGKINWCFWLLVALALVIILFFITGSILAQKTSDKVDQFDAAGAAGGVAGGLLSLFKK